MHKHLRCRRRAQNYPFPSNLSNLIVSPLSTYCLFCRAGQEGKVMDCLCKGGISCFSPQVDRWKPEKSGSVKRLCRLLPGYVFIESEEEPDWNELRKISGVLRVLSYADGTYALRGSDMGFIAWLKSLNGIIEVSLVIQEGSKIQFIEGPLANMSGHIVKVNKKRRAVAVQFGDGESLFQTIWCSFDYVQSSADTASMEQRYL